MDLTTEHRFHSPKSEPSDISDVASANNGNLPRAAFSIDSLLHRKLNGQLKSPIPKEENIMPPEIKMESQSLTANQDTESPSRDHPVFTNEAPRKSPAATKITKDDNPLPKLPPSALLNAHTLNNHNNLQTAQMLQNWALMSQSAAALAASFSHGSSLFGTGNHTSANSLGFLQPQILARFAAMRAAATSNTTGGLNFPNMMPNMNQMNPHTQQNGLNLTQIANKMANKSSQNGQNFQKVSKTPVISGVQKSVQIPKTTFIPNSVKNGPTGTTLLQKPASKKYKCDICFKAFSRSNTLITHKRIHTGEKPFKCEHCGRAFRQPGNLTRHRLTHTTVKPYICAQCGKAFNRASNLHTHMRTHNGLRPFTCSHCGKGFHQKVDLKIHSYTHATGEQTAQSLQQPTAMPNLMPALT